MLKWQLYNKEPYIEIYFRGDTPRSFSEWVTVRQAISSNEEKDCICWLYPNAFVSHGGYDSQWLNSVTRDKRNFPKCYFRVSTTKQLLYIWATNEMEAFCTLYEMTMYSDFASSFETLWHLDDENHMKLPRDKGNESSFYWRY